MARRHKVKLAPANGTAETATRWNVVGVDGEVMNGQPLPLAAAQNMLQEIHDGVWKPSPGEPPAGPVGPEGPFDTRHVSGGRYRVVDGGGDPVHDGLLPSREVAVTVKTRLEKGDDLSEILASVGAEPASTDRPGDSRADDEQPA